MFKSNLKKIVWKPQYGLKEEQKYKQTDTAFTEAFNKYLVK